MNFEIKPSITVILILIFVSCKNETKNVEAPFEEELSIKYESFGKEIIPDDAIAANSIMHHYNSMAIGDSIPVKVNATVNEVCQAKGCWMTLNLIDGEEVMVKFKDYDFFVPKDISGKKVIVNGNAYVSEMSVDEQRHYSEDAGESQEEINSITKPKKIYSLEADGVLIAQ